MSAAALALALRGVGWGVPGRRILDGISLDVAPGEFVGLIGPNGSGKSSLLRCAYRVHRPAAGQVLLDGTDLWSLPAATVARQVAVVLQELPAGFGLSAGAVAALGRTPHPAAPNDRHRVADALARVDMAGHADRPFETLSGGEKQRVLFARALVQQPRLLILDEPTNHLDIRHQRDLLRLVRGLGISVLASLHDLNQAAAYCDRIQVLAAGRTVVAGMPAEVLTAPLIEAVFGVPATVERPAGGPPFIRYAA